MTDIGTDLETSIWQLTALQLCSSPDPVENLQQIAALLQQIPADRPQLVALPEGALCFAGADGANLAIAEPLAEQHSVVVGHVVHHGNGHQAWQVAAYQQAHALPAACD